MTGVHVYYRSTIGKKVVMAITGILLTGFVFIHMIGNLKIYLPDHGEHLNHYGKFLRTMGEPILLYGQGLWMFRLVMGAALALHVLSGLQLTLAAWNARPVGYRQQAMNGKYLATMMRYGGVGIGLFIVAHVLHLTVGVHPNFIHGEIYHNVIGGFQNVVVSVLYIVAMVALGVHIFHGGWSLFQTLGLNNRRWKPVWETVAALIALAVAVGNISIPLAVLAGVLTLP